MLSNSNILYVGNITLLDMENTVRYLNFVDGLWLTASLYETNHESIIIYQRNLKEKTIKLALIGVFFTSSQAYLNLNHFEVAGFIGLILSTVVS
jgi:hypothetical protein